MRRLVKVNNVDKLKIMNSSVSKHIALQNYLSCRLLKFESMAPNIN